MDGMDMVFRQCDISEFDTVQNFYWQLIDLMSSRTDTVGWKKGIYPSDDFLRGSLEAGELYALEDEDGRMLATVICNSAYNEGYRGIKWGIDCPDEDALVPHALAVFPTVQGRGIGKQVVRQIIALAEEKGKKTVRLDVLSGNPAAERLYTGMGFRFVEAKTMFYEDTGWKEFRMFEYIL